LIVLYFCFVFLRFVYPVLPVSLDYPFLIASSVFSKVYLPLIVYFIHKKHNNWIIVYLLAHAVEEF
jgi:hypothetical protein